MKPAERVINFADPSPELGNASVGNDFSASNHLLVGFYTETGIVSKSMTDLLQIADKTFESRLMVGTGRHRSMEEMVSSITASGAEIITVAIGRLDLSNPNEKTILDHFDWNEYTVLPNTAGSATAEQAVLTARLGREVTGSDWGKLEVIPNPKHLLPDPVGTYEAAVELIKDGRRIENSQLISKNLKGRLTFSGGHFVEDDFLKIGGESEPYISEVLIGNKLLSSKQFTNLTVRELF